MTSVTNSNLHRIASDELERKRSVQLSRNWNLASYFPHIRVLTMDPKAQRFTECKKEFEKIGLKTHQYVIELGVDGKKLDKSLWNRMESWDIKQKKCPRKYLTQRKQGQMGCFIAHYEVIKKAKQCFDQAVKEYRKLQSSPSAKEKDLRLKKEEVEKYSSVLIFEDNVGFGRVTGQKTSELADYGVRFRLAIRDLPSDWDMLYFKSMKFDDNPVEKIGSPYLAKLTYGVVTKCYAINAKFYDRVVVALEEELKALSIEPVDNVIARLHKTANCYVMTPPLAYRRASTSQVLGGGFPPPTAEQLKHWQSDAD